jgi:hypothetical protein
MRARVNGWHEASNDFPGPAVVCGHLPMIAVPPAPADPPAGCQDCLDEGTLATLIALASSDRLAHSGRAGLPSAMRVKPRVFQPMARPGPDRPQLPLTEAHTGWGVVHHGPFR